MQRKRILILAGILAMAGVLFAASGTRLAMVQGGCFGNKACEEAGKKGIAENWPVQDLLFRMAQDAYSDGVSTGNIDIGTRQAVGILRATMEKVRTMPDAELAVGQTQDKYKDAQGGGRLREDFILIEKWCRKKATIIREIRCYFKQLGNISVFRGQ